VLPGGECDRQAEKTLRCGPITGTDQCQPAASLKTAWFSGIRDPCCCLSVTTCCKSCSHWQRQVED